MRPYAGRGVLRAPPQDDERGRASGVVAGAAPLEVVVVALDFPGALPVGIGCDVVATLAVVAAFCLARSFLRCADQRS